MFEKSSKLVVIEKEDVYLVAWADDPQDWVVSFLKKMDFPARQWAERMVYLNNHGSSANGVTLTENNSNNPKVQSVFYP